MVHQHFQLIPVFTVAENVVLGDELRTRRRARPRQRPAPHPELGEQYGLHVDPDAAVGDLSVGEQQRVELVKALYREADILILDEPTAVLTPGEVDDFFGVVRSLVDQGKSIIFITHKLREVLAVADRIVVLRRRQVVGTADPADGHPAEPRHAHGRPRRRLHDRQGARAPGEPGSQVRELSVADDRGVTTVDGLDLEVRAGEVFGIAGVEGNGQRELVEALDGHAPDEAGHVEIDGARRHPRRAAPDHRAGVGHVPEDRDKHGVVARSRSPTTSC